MTLLSIDPGKRIGWAVFSEEGDELGRGVLDFDMFSHSLHYRPGVSSTKLVFTPRGKWSGPNPVLIDKIVYEAYYLDPSRPQGGSTGPAQEVVGVLKYLALQAGIVPTAQRSAILPVAMKHHGYVQTKAHLPDQDSAWLHGMYYLVATGVISPQMP